MQAFRHGVRFVNGFSKDRGGRGGRPPGFLLMTTAHRSVSGTWDLWGVFVFSHGWTWLFWGLITALGLNVWASTAGLVLLISGASVSPSAAPS